MVYGSSSGGYGGGCCGGGGRGSLGACDVGGGGWLRPPSLLLGDGGEWQGRSVAVAAFGSPAGCAGGALRSQASLPLLHTVPPLRSPLRWPVLFFCSCFFSSIGRCDAGPLAHVAAVAEQCNPNRGSTVKLYDLRTGDGCATTPPGWASGGASVGALGAGRCVGVLSTGHAMLLRLGTLGSLLLASHAFVDAVEAYDCRMLVQWAGGGGGGGSGGSSRSGALDDGSGESWDPELRVRATVVRRWRSGRGGDFAATARGVATVGTHHSPGARLRLFHHDVAAGPSKGRAGVATGSRDPVGGCRAQRAAAGQRAGVGTVASDGAGAAHGVDLGGRWTREVPVSAVTVDEWQARVQGPPRGLSCHDDGACALYLDASRLFVLV